MNKLNSLDFHNKKSQEHYALTCENADSLKVLLNESDLENNSDKRKGYNRIIKQLSFEAVEHLQKSVLYADTNHEAINMKTFRNLKHSHDIVALQSEQQKSGINVFSKDDIDVITDSVKKSSPKENLYNSIRYKVQNIDIESVRKTVDIVDNAINFVASLF